MAVSGEEKTTVVMLPSFSDITGPYLRDSLAREWWGLGPSWRMLPMIGSPYGPGGSFDDFQARDIRMHIHAMDARMIEDVTESMRKKLVSIGGVLNFYLYK